VESLANGKTPLRSLVFCGRHSPILGRFIESLGEGNADPSGVGSQAAQALAELSLTELEEKNSTWSFPES
jgi:hypothetical protein